MPRVSSLILAGALVFAALPAQAQLDPAVIAQGQVLSGMHRGHAERGYRAQRWRTTVRQAAACANKGRYRSQHGVKHPQVRRLYSLCRAAGL